MKANGTSRSIRNSASSSAQLLLWLLLILLPVIAARFIFAAAITLEKQLEDSRMRQRFSIELKKYDTLLEPRQWIRHALHADDFDRIMHNYYNEQGKPEDYLQHPFLGLISNPGSDNEDCIKIFSRHFSRFTGTAPDIVMIIASEPAKCDWQITPPFRQPRDAMELRQTLSRGWKIISERIKKLQGKLQDHSRYINTDSEFCRIFGIFDYVSSNLNMSKVHFSTANNNELFISLLPLPDSDGRLDSRFVLSAVSAANLNPRHMLKIICQKFTSSFSKHIFGSTSLESLPKFFEINGKLSLIGSTPESFRKLAWKHIEKGGKPLAIFISDARKENSENRKKLIGIFLLIYVLFMTVFMGAIKSGRIKSVQSIQRTVSIGLFAGMLLPLSGSIWFGICYLNTSRHLEAEDVLDRMHSAAFITDQSIKNQLSRNALFRNLFAEMLSRWQPDQLKRLNEKTGFFAEESPGWPGNNRTRVADLIDSYHIFHPEIDDITGMRSNRQKITETPYLFIGGHATNILHQLGAMSHLPPGKIQQIINRSQYTMGFLDNIIDNRLTSRTFAEEKSPIPHTMSTRREQLTTSLWRDKSGKVSGISILQTDSGSWVLDLSELCKGAQSGRFFHTTATEYLSIFISDSLTTTAASLISQQKPAYRTTWPGDNSGHWQKPCIPSAIRFVSTTLTLMTRT